ncbi:hypothetical protein H0I29_02820 [Polaribacter sp. R2A056_3_33]|jgi:hypothetical protein|uniref:hypothetical protein n=1 Tax=Polaribacter sp. R2A056_3_33 TaxID=2745563 RepID=UPI001C50152C|nr:hypothetical protein [Polaribacter sp. R2A056_3_33]QXP71044.1 hypothetical protein H0I29_02820 [Polaribacter sp. R2A056_3_33]
MPLFQTSVLEGYLNLQDKEQINKAIKANNKLLVKDGLTETPTLPQKNEFE